MHRNRTARRRAIMCSMPRRMAWLGLTLALGIGSLGGHAGGHAPAMPAAEAHDHGISVIRIAYGSEPLQFGDLRLPPGRGPHPVAVVIHGGCWFNLFGLELMDAMSATLTSAGVATWNIEYRRVGDVGGGFPTTLTDVGMAIDTLRDLAPIYDLNLERVITVGHSAGGHLGVWAGARHLFPVGHPLRGPDPVPLHASVALAGIMNLAAYLNINPCGAFVGDFMGGTPAEVPEHYALAEVYPIVKTKMSDN